MFEEFSQIKNFFLEYDGLRDELRIKILNTDLTFIICGAVQSKGRLAADCGYAVDLP